MTAHKNPAAVALGRRGGRATSDRKTAAARANGARGGRPMITIHLAAPGTHWTDGLPACGRRRGYGRETADGFTTTHELTNVTCAACQARARTQGAA